MTLTPEWRDRINAWRDELPRHFYHPISPVHIEAGFTHQQFRHTEVLDRLEFSPVETHSAWGAKWEYGWFKSYLVMPDTASGQMIALKLDVGAESAVYINGDYAGAVDEKHTVLILTDSARPGTKYQILLEAYAGHGPRESHAGPTPPWRETVPEPLALQCVVGESHFGVWDEQVFQLAIDVETLWEVRENIDADSLRVMEIDEGLKAFTLAMDFEAPESEMRNRFQKARACVAAAVSQTEWGHHTGDDRVWARAD